MTELLNHVSISSKTDTAIQPLLHALKQRLTLTETDVKQGSSEATFSVSFNFLYYRTSIPFNLQLLQIKEIQNRLSKLSIEIPFQSSTTTDFSIHPTYQHLSFNPFQFPEKLFIVGGFLLNTGIVTKNAGKDCVTVDVAVQMPEVIPLITTKPAYLR